MRLRRPPGAEAVLKPRVRGDHAHRPLTVRAGRRVPPLVDYRLELGAGVSLAPVHVGGAVADARPRRVRYFGGAFFEVRV